MTAVASVRFLTPEQAARRLRRGDALHMEFADGRRQWWFENPYAFVEDHVVRSLGRQPGGLALVEASDSLFRLSEQSQTWQAMRRSA